MAVDPGPPGPDSYAFGQSGAARQAFGGRTLAADLAFLVPYLRPGLRVVDCGCGGGGLTLQLAERVAPGEVVGFDLNTGAIMQAQELSVAQGAANVRFLVASVHAAQLPDNHFDIALFCGVLGHVPEPERALQQAYRLLKPGGVLAARELAKQGDWFGGSYWETIQDINDMHVDAIVAGGGEPFLGQRLKSLLAAAGFRDVQATPGFSPALSSVAAIGALYLQRLQEPDFVAKVVARGRFTPERLREMIPQVEAWRRDACAIAAISECTALGWKPAEA